MPMKRALKLTISTLVLLTVALTAGSDNGRSSESLSACTNGRIVTNEGETNYKGTMERHGVKSDHPAVSKIGKGSISCGTRMGLS